VPYLALMQVGLNPTKKLYFIMIYLDT